MLVNDREIMREYARVRATNTAELEARRKEAFALCPDLEQVEAALKDEAFSLAKKLASAENRDVAAKEAEARIAELRLRKSALLKLMGFPQDQLEMRYRCSLCHDTGFVGDAPRRPCVCLKQRRLRLMYASSAIDNGECFETFDLDLFASPAQRELMKKIKAFFEQYSDTFPDTEVKTLMLIGKPGLGKSFLLNCVAQRVLVRGHSVAKLTAYNLINGILANIRAGEAVETYEDADLLIIDDLGTEPMMDNITREYLFSIINERQTAMKHTAVATNLSIDELQDMYGERLFSRLMAPRFSKVQRLVGEDVRLHGV